MTDTHVKSINTISWNVRVLATRVNNKQVTKIKSQRKRQWLILPNPRNSKTPSIRAYIDNLRKYGNSGMPVTIARMYFDQYLNIDGNNRIYSIIFYVSNPFKVYPEHFTTLKNFIEATYDPEVHEMMLDKMASLSLDGIDKFRHNKFGRETDLYKKHLQSHHEEWQDFYEGVEGGHGFKDKFTINRDSFLDVNINLLEYIGYTKEELNGVYNDMNKYNTTMSSLDQSATELHDSTDFEILDQHAKIRIENGIKTFYTEKNEGEILECYEYDGTMNAYEFVVGYHNACHSTYGRCIAKLKQNGNKCILHLLWETMYKKENFATDRVTAFITRIDKIMMIYENILDGLFPSNLYGSLKPKGTKIPTIPLNSNFILLSIIAGHLHNETPDAIMINSCKSCLIHYLFTNDINDRDRKDFLQAKNPLRYITGGNAHAVLSSSMYKNPNIASDFITRSVMDTVTSELIRQSIKTTHSKTRKCRPFHEVAMVISFYNRNMPNEFIRGGYKFWSEHIVPFSSSYDGEIDIDRFGNTIPILDRLNNRRGAKHIRAYTEIEKKLSVDFVKYLDPIIPDIPMYDSIVSHGKKSSSIVENIDKFNDMCKRNEKTYTETFLDSMFGPIKE